MTLLFCLNITVVMSKGVALITSKKALLIVGVFVLFFTWPVFINTALAQSVDGANVNSSVESSGHNEEVSDPEGHDNLPLVLFFLAIMLLFAGFGKLAKKIDQPPVLGELVMGIILGIFALIPGLGIIDVLRHNELVVAFAEVGVILLLFKTGLETNVRDMMQVGVRALLVACVGVVLPFLGGYFLSSWILPESMTIAGREFSTFLFLGATLTATSVGITARVFSDLNFGKSKEARIVLGAAVIDDVFGLIILAVVSGIVGALAAGSSFSTFAIGGLSLKLTLMAFAFIGGSIFLGQFLAPKLSKFFAKIHAGEDMKMMIALLFCFSAAYGSSALVGLAPIVGAFAAGLLLDPVHFNSFEPPAIVKKLKLWGNRVSSEIKEEMDKVAEHETHIHVEDLVNKIAFYFVPLFFVYTGMQVDVMVFFRWEILVIGLAITAVAFAGKIASGLAAGSGVDKKIVGLGMVPRGEVGLIFINEGKKLGVVNDEIFAIAVIVVILSTLLTPIILNYLIKKKS